MRTVRVGSLYCKSCKSPAIFPKGKNKFECDGCGFEGNKKDFQDNKNGLQSSLVVGPK